MTLQATMVAIAKVLRTVKPPENAKEFASVTDEPPGEIHVYPTVICIEDEADVEFRGAGTGTSSSRAMRYTIGVHVLFAPSTEPKMAYRERRPWLAPLLDLFQDNPKLDGKVTSSDVRRADLEPYAWGGVDYVAINLTLEVLDDE